MRRANFPQAFAWPKLEAPSQIGTHDPAHAYAGSQAWVRNKPSHIASNSHLWHSQGHKGCTSRCNRSSLGQIRSQRNPWRTPKCSHGSSPPLISLSSTMWRHSLSSRIRQAPRSNVVQPWRYVYNPPFQQAKHPQPFSRGHHQNSQA